MNKKTTTKCVEVGDANFEAEVVKAALPVVVLFGAPWSHPCRIMDRLLEEVAADCGSQAKVVKVNADANPALSLLLEVQAVPTLLYFVGGNVCDRMVGTASKDVILARLAALLADGPGSQNHPIHFGPDTSSTGPS